MILFFLLFVLSIQIPKGFSCSATTERLCINYCYDLIETDIKCVNESFSESQNYLPVNGDRSYLEYTNFITFINSTLNTISNSLFTRYKEINTIIANDSHIQIIKSGAFRGLEKLLKLSLENNEISSIKSGTFEDLTSLKILNISHNQISLLEDDLFESLSNLEILDISYNNLKDIDAKLFEKTGRLSELYLSYNNIEIKENFIFSNVHHLKILDLETNHLQNDFISSLIFAPLTIMNLGNNQISFSDDIEFALFTNLEKLTLSKNRIKRDLVFNNSITYLDVSFTMLSLSERTLKNCTNLNELLLNNNNITNIDIDLFSSLSKLKNLQLQYNNIQEIPVGSFRNLHDLQILNLSFNQLHHLESGVINSLENLLILNLSNNMLKNLEVNEFYSFRHIQMINLDNNLLSTLDITKMFLYLHRNVSLPTSISLHNNFWKCSWLPEAIGLLQKNNFIVLRGNSFKVKNFKGITCIDDTKYESTTYMYNMTTLKSNPRLQKIPTTAVVVVTTTIPAEITTKDVTTTVARQKNISTKSSYSTSVGITPGVKSTTEREKFNNKYFENLFNSYKAEQRKMQINDRTEEMWKIMNKMMSFLTFIIVFIVFVLIYFIFYFVQFTIIKKYREKSNVSNKEGIQSCDIELINSNSE